MGISILFPIISRKPRQIINKNSIWIILEITEYSCGMQNSRLSLGQSLFTKTEKPRSKSKIGNQRVWTKIWRNSKSLNLGSNVKQYAHNDEMNK